MIAASSSSGGIEVESPAQTAPIAAGELLGFQISRRGERENALSLMNRNLCDDVGGRSESVNSKTLHGFSRHPVGPVPDQARAKQRRSVYVGHPFGERKTKPLVRNRVLRVPTVDIVAGKKGVVAEVFLAPPAEPALAAGIAKPRHSHALTGAMILCAPPSLHHCSNDLVSNDQGQLGLGQLAVNDVKIRAADSAGAYFDQHLIRSGLRDRNIRRTKRLVGSVQHHCAHTPMLPQEAVFSSQQSLKTEN